MTNKANGFVLNDAQSGTIFIGPDDASRKRQVQISSTSGATVKLYEDGGFEIHSQRSQKKTQISDNIISRSRDGLSIKSTGDLRIQTDGVLTLGAKEIRLEQTHSKSDLVIRSNSNINIEAKDTLKMTGSIVAIGARTKLLINSKGSTYIKSSGGETYIVDSNTKLIPTSLGDLFDKIIETLFPSVV